MTIRNRIRRSRRAAGRLSGLCAERTQFFRCSPLRRNGFGQLREGARGGFGAFVADVPRAQLDRARIAWHSGRKTKPFSGRCLFAEKDFGRSNERAHVSFDDARDAPPQSRSRGSRSAAARVRLRRSERSRADWSSRAQNEPNSSSVIPCRGKASGSRALAHAAPPKQRSAACARRPLARAGAPIAPGAKRSHFLDAHLIWERVSGDRSIARTGVSAGRSTRPRDAARGPISLRSTEK